VAESIYLNRSRLHEQGSESWVLPYIPAYLTPQDLAVIDQVYEAAWAQIEAREPFRDRSRDDERQQSLRETIFVIAGSGPVDFDDLCDKVVSSLPEYWAPPSARSKRGGGGIAA
jgi:hypothetical protein